MNTIDRGWPRPALTDSQVAALLADSPFERGLAASKAPRKVVDLSALKAKLHAIRYVWVDTGWPKMYAGILVDTYAERLGHSWSATVVGQLAHGTGAARLAPTAPTRNLRS